MIIIIIEGWTCTPGRLLFRSFQTPNCNRFGTFNFWNYYYYIAFFRSFRSFLWIWPNSWFWVSQITSFSYFEKWTHFNIFRSFDRLFPQMWWNNSLTLRPRYVDCSNASILDADCQQRTSLPAHIYIYLFRRCWKLIYENTKAFTSVFQVSIFFPL